MANNIHALIYNDFNVLLGKREIKALGIRCSHVDWGCQWEGTIGTLKQHVDTCEFGLVLCPKKCKDWRKKFQHFMRRDLDRHLERDCPNRDYSCQNCGEMGTYDGIVNIHDKICEKKTLPCSNADCIQTMERQQITEHVRTQCPYTVISCKYKGIGCTSQLKRRDMAAHEKNDDYLHLHMALDTVNTLQDEVSTLKSLTVTSNGMTFAITDYQEKMEARAVFTSPSFYTHPSGYRMAVSVYCYFNNGPIADISALILEGACDTALKWPFRGKVNLKLLNQSEDTKHYRSSAYITDGYVGSKVKLCILKLSPTTTILEKVMAPYAQFGLIHINKAKYLENNTVYFRVSVEVYQDKPWLQCTAK